MRTHILPLVAVIALATSACNDTPRSITAPAAPAAPSSGTVAFLTVSNPNAAAGSTVTVTATARQAMSLARVGAFSARLKYDASGLTYAGEQALPGMRAINPRAGDIAAAGASPDGFTDGQLFAVTFTVVNPAALASLRLEIAELNGTDFGNHLKSLDLRTQLYTSRR